MFEAPSQQDIHDAALGEKRSEAIVVSGAENGGIVIRQRSAVEDKGYVVVPPEQAESLIAAIRRHLKPGK